MLNIHDEVITKVAVEDIPAGTFGVVSEVDDEGVWVDVFIPEDSDLPYDTVLYAEEDLKIQ